jgi:steroid delta-isomerase-like uncharacterized protein
MTRAEIERVLHAYADAKNRHDVEAIVALLAADAFYESAGFGPRIEGRDGLRAYYTALFEAIPGYFGEFDGAAYGDDAAAVWGRFGGALGELFLDRPVERGRRIEVPVTFVCTFCDGLLVGDTGYFDAATLAEQAGVALELIRGGIPAESAAGLRASAA